MQKHQHHMAMKCLIIKIMIYLQNYVEPLRQLLYLTFRPKYIH